MGYQASEKKSDISMSSTKRGNTVHIIVDAFQHDESSDTYKFMSVNLQRTVEIGEGRRYSSAGGGTKALKAICSLGIWNLVNHCQDEAAKEEGELAKKLQDES